MIQSERKSPSSEYTQAKQQDPLATYRNASHCAWGNSTRTLTVNESPTLSAIFTWHNIAITLIDGVNAPHFPFARAAFTFSSKSCAIFCHGL